VAAERQEGGSAAISEAPWVTILVALVAVLAFLLGQAGLRETVVEIVLADAIFVALVAILVYRVEAHLAVHAEKGGVAGAPRQT
jgi:hypothetical protein